MNLSTNPENNPGDVKPSHRPSIEDAQRAAATINEYMRELSRSRSESAFQGARVATLGSFTAFIDKRERQCWIVNRWDWDHIGLSSMLFVERENGQFHLFDGDTIFLEKDLYPEHEQQATAEEQPEATPESQLQEGGAA